ncbi:unnamed protein product [Lactuca virosa]|uniref:Uncharacterized protein n=1 Tax=Lactuca virosa TaxID=75947 RepID=A0AAU9NF92_9ASTR|nr:unnamed protein product [Lactuca virosa]
MNLILHALVILAMVPFCIASTSNAIMYRMYITNGIEDNIEVHVFGKDQDYQGQRTLAFNEEFDYKIRVKVGTISRVEISLKFKDVIG